jgi:hypothetical protein
LASAFDTTTKAINTNFAQSNLLFNMSNIQLNNKLDNISQTTETEIKQMIFIIALGFMVIMAKK